MEGTNKASCAWVQNMKAYFHCFLLQAWAFEAEYFTLTQVLGNGTASPLYQARDDADLYQGNTKGGLE